MHPNSASRPYAKHAKAGHRFPGHPPPARRLHRFRSSPPISSPRVFRLSPSAGIFSFSRKILLRRFERSRAASHFGLRSADRDRLSNFQIRTQRTPANSRAQRFRRDSPSGLFPCHQSFPPHRRTHSPRSNSHRIPHHARCAPPPCHGDLLYRRSHLSRSANSRSLEIRTLLSLPAYHLAPSRASKGFLAFPPSGLHAPR